MLTWLLRENLGGNSKTAMIAAISPADINYEETLSTLRYADRAKQIMCTAVINEDANAKLIRELRDEIARLRDILVAEGIQLNIASISIEVPKKSNVKQIKSAEDPKESDDQQQQVVKESKQSKLIKAHGSVSIAGENAIEALQETEKLMSELEVTWEEKLKRTEAIRAQREAVLAEMGVARRADGDAVGVFSPSDTPHLLNLNEDPLMSECLLYYLKDGDTRVGQDGAPVVQDIRLSGTNILVEHCIFENKNGTVRLIPLSPEALCFVNGRRVTEPIELKTGARVILGKYHVFRFQHPGQIRSSSATAARPGSTDPNQAATSVQPVDWTFAQMELLEKQGIDLKVEMEQKLLSLEEQYRKEKAEADQSFMEAKKNYEQEIERLQKQVNEQSMTMSQMFSSMSHTLSRHGGDSPGSSGSRSDSDEERSTAHRKRSMLLSMSMIEFTPLDRWQEAVTRKALLKWRYHQFTSLRDDLWGNAIFLKEANAMSVELKKRVQFQFVILTDTIYSPISLDLLVDYMINDNALLANGAGSGAVGTIHAHLTHQLSLSIDGEDELIFPKTIVAVEVKDQKNGATHYWSLTKLR